MFLTIANGYFSLAFALEPSVSPNSPTLLTQSMNSHHPGRDFVMRDNKRVHTCVAFKIGAIQKYAFENIREKG